MRRLLLLVFALFLHISPLTATKVHPIQICEKYSNIYASQLGKLVWKCIVDCAVEIGALCAAKRGPTASRVSLVQMNLVRLHTPRSHAASTRASVLLRLRLLEDENLHKIRLVIQ